MYLNYIKLLQVNNIIILLETFSRKNSKINLANYIMNKWQKVVFKK